MVILPKIEKSKFFIFWDFSVAGSLFFSRAGVQALEKIFFFQNSENTSSQLSYALSSVKKY